MSSTKYKRYLKIDVGAGLTVPDWSVVTSKTVRNALGEIFENCNWNHRWAGLGEDAYRTRCAILKSYAKSGHAPSIDDLALNLGFTSEQVKTLIGQLAARDMVITSEDCTTVTGAYPFVSRDSEHRVHLPDTSVNAMCAIDALGTGVMLNTDVSITSACRHCSTLINIQIGKKGQNLTDFTPKHAVVWAGIEYADSCAANSLCTNMAFFCSDPHLNAWQVGQSPKPTGYRLSMHEGLQLGKAIFRPLMSAIPS